LEACTCLEKLAGPLRRALTDFPAVLVTGPRQSGKTTFLRAEAGQRAAYVSLDDPFERGFAVEDPNGFLERFGSRPVILDEIQQAPTLLPHLKLRIDAERSRPAAGCSRVAAVRPDGRVSESLAGRVAILQLLLSHLPRRPVSPACRSLKSCGEEGIPSPRCARARGTCGCARTCRPTSSAISGNCATSPTSVNSRRFVALAAGRHARRPTSPRSPGGRRHAADRPGVARPPGSGVPGPPAAALPPQLRQAHHQVAPPRLPRLRAAVCADTAAERRGGARGRHGRRDLRGVGGQRGDQVLRECRPRGRRLLLALAGRRRGRPRRATRRATGPIEAKLTASPSPGHVGPIRRFIELAGVEAAETGLLVCQVKERKSLPGGHLALPWGEFPAWLEGRLTTKLNGRARNPKRVTPTR